MPYLTDERKKELSDPDSPERVARDTAELCYLACEMVDDYFLDKGISYKTYAECIAALETAKLEIARRFAWYEQQKMRANGDVLRNTQPL